MCCSHLFNDPLLQQAILLGSHDKVVGVVFVVDNILQINTWMRKWRESMVSIEGGREREKERGRIRKADIKKKILSVSLAYLLMLFYWIYWRMGKQMKTHGSPSELISRCHRPRLWAHTLLLHHSTTPPQISKPTDTGLSTGIGGQCLIL